MPTETTATPFSATSNDSSAPSAGHFGAAPVTLATPETHDGAEGIATPACAVDEIEAGGFTQGLDALQDIVDAREDGDLPPARRAPPSPCDETAANGVALALRVEVLRRAFSAAVKDLIRETGGGAIGTLGAMQVCASMHADADLAVASTALAADVLTHVDALLAATPTTESPELQRSRRLADALDDLDAEEGDSTIAAYDRTHGAPIRVPTTDFLTAQRHNTAPIPMLTPIPAPVSHHKGKYPTRAAQSTVEVAQ